MWSDLFLATGGIVNWNNGTLTLTQNAGALTMAHASLSFLKLGDTNIGGNAGRIGLQDTANANYNLIDGTESGFLFSHESLFCNITLTGFLYSGSTGVTGITGGLTMAGNTSGAVTLTVSAVAGGATFLLPSTTGSHTLLYDGGPGGTPSSLVLTNATAVPAGQITGVIPIANLATGTPTGSKFIRDDGTLQTIAGGGDALVANPLSQFAATTSLQLKGVISDETGSGALVFATLPSFTTGINIGTTAPASAGVIRIENAAWIASRNAANGADVNMFRVNTSDQIEWPTTAALTNIDNTLVNTGEILKLGMQKASTTNPATASANPMVSLDLRTRGAGLSSQACGAIARIHSA